MKRLSLPSKNEEDTASIAKNVAKAITTPIVIALYGTLGMGKSVFARAFIRHFLKNEEVPSPTYTLLQVYETEKLPIYHFDLYRLKSQEEAFELGIEDCFHSGISLIEWPEKIEHLLPQNAVKIYFESTDTGRVLSFSINE